MSFRALASQGERCHLQRLRLITQPLHLTRAGGQGVVPGNGTPARDGMGSTCLSVEPQRLQQQQARIWLLRAGRERGSFEMRPFATPLLHQHRLASVVAVLARVFTSDN